MRIVVAVAAVILLLVGIVLFVPRFRPDSADSHVKIGDNVSVSSGHAGGFLSALGLIVLLFLYVTGSSDDAKNDKPSPQSTIQPPPTARPSGSTPPSASASGAVTSSPNSQQQSATPSISATAAQSSPTAIASAPPWEAEVDGLTLVVEKVGPSKAIPGREAIQLRLQNETGYGLSIPADGFVAVDGGDVSYGPDETRSLFDFDSDDGYLGSGPFEDGTTRRGVVVLDSDLTPGAINLQVRFTVKYVDPNDGYTDRNFTVSVYTTVPAGLP